MLPLVALVLFLVLLVFGVRRWRGQAQLVLLTSLTDEDVGRSLPVLPLHGGPQAAAPGGCEGDQDLQQQQPRLLLPVQMLFLCVVHPKSICLLAGEASGDADEEEEQEHAGYYVAKSARKKDAKKQENEARRQAEALARESRQEKVDHYAEMRRRKDEEREAEELRKEEAARLQKEKEEAAANEEFEKWKGAFSVENEGTLAAEEAETQGLINDFVDFIKEHKCVGIEDLAGEFKMKSQDCINRIQELEQMGRLSGVMDDRGKFICISPEEMQAVADYIKRMGRVSIAHLARKSNEFIDLQSKAGTAQVPTTDPETSELETDSIAPIS